MFHKFCSTSFPVKSENKYTSTSNTDRHTEIEISLDSAFLVYEKMSLIQLIYRQILILFLLNYFLYKPVELQYH